DGRNALLTFTAAAAGTYFIEVSASTATATPTKGEYVLSITGNTVTLPPFQVTTTNPADGAVLRIAPTTMTVDFNDSVLVSSLQASDLKVDGVSATGFTVVDGDTVSFNLPGPLAEGTRTVTVAAGDILDVQGTPINAFTSTFFLDTTGPRVT